MSTSVCLLVLLLVGAHLGRSASTSDGAYRHMAVFTDVLSRIKSDYVEEPDLKNVTLGAVNGLLESVDPFASYLNADQYKQYLKEKDASRGDVGLVLAKRYGYVAVVSALPGSPAAKAGLSTGDLIESIKGVATRDMPLAYAEILLKGQPGSDVEISLLHVPDPEPQKVTLTRAVVLIPPVTARMLPDQIGYIRPETMLTGKSGRDRRRGEQPGEPGSQGAHAGPCGNAPWGHRKKDIAVANLFLDKGLMTYLQGQQLPRKNFQADPAKAITRLPLVVTTNRGTADGAEIAAIGVAGEQEGRGGRRAHASAMPRSAAPSTWTTAGPLSSPSAKYYSQHRQGHSGYRSRSLRAVRRIRAVVRADDETPQQPRPRSRHQAGRRQPAQEGD